MTPTGNAIGSNCLGWTRMDMGSDGMTGSSLQTGPAWTGSSGDTCDEHHPVYCFEVIP